MEKTVKCINTNCTFKTECLRYFQTANEGDYYIFQPDLVCEKEDYKYKISK